MRHQTIEARDLDAVVGIYMHRFLTGRLIKELPLTSGGFPSQQVTNRRLRALERIGFVKPFKVPGFPERVFRVTQKGLHVVADRLGLTLDDLPWTKYSYQPKDYYFIRHFMLTNKFRIALARACEGNQTELAGFIPEYYGKKHASGRVTKYVKDSVKDVVFGIQSVEEKISHAPDAVFSLARGERKALFFLEIDRGTESLSNPEKGVYKMIRFYLGYSETEQFKTYEEEFKATFERFRVLIVVTSWKRLQNMRKAMDVLPAKFNKRKRFFWLCVFDEETPIATADEWFWRPIWCSLDAGDDKRYSLG